MASMLLGDGCPVAETVRNSEVVDTVFRFYPQPYSKP